VAATGRLLSANTEFYCESSGDSRMNKLGGALWGQGKSRGANINVSAAW